MQPTADDSDFDIKFTEAKIRSRLEALAEEISTRGLENLLVVAILKGSFIFAADLLRALHRVGLNPEVDFVTLSSYRRSRVSSGKVEVLRDMDLDVSGRSVLVIDDVLDSGRTLAFAKNLIAARGARDVLSCVLIDKRVPRAAEVEADFKAFDCNAEFVVGYGMDAAHRYRELPFVAVLKDDSGT